MLVYPIGERDEPVGPDSIHTPAAIVRCDYQPRRFQPLEMLHDRGAGNRQAAREIAGIREVSHRTNTFDSLPGGRVYSIDAGSGVAR